MKVYVCALAKNEHLYINEWVSHYFKLGVDKIFIFDNDDKNAPSIKDYIDKVYLDKVRIINARGIHKKSMQNEFYENFYHVEKDNFDWAIYCDIDEFLVGVDDIKAFLRQPQFANADQIRIKWKLFGDDDLIERDMNKTVMETFTKEITHSLNRNLIDIGDLEIQGKAIVRGHLNNVCICSPHYACVLNRLLPSVLPNGKKCESLVRIYEDYSNINVFFNHYMTKSLSEFVKQKLNRGDAIFEKRQLKLDYYWRINRQTQEKIEYLQNLGLV